MSSHLSTKECVLKFNNNEINKMLKGIHEIITSSEIEWNTDRFPPN